MTKGPSTSVMTEAEEEASHDKTSIMKRSEPKQEVVLNHLHPNAPQPVYTNMYVPYIKGLKMDWMVMMHYTTDFSNGNSNVRTF